MAENTEFQRENRYIVIKRKDLRERLGNNKSSGFSGLSAKSKPALEEYLDGIATAIRKDRLPLECVVIESDWSIYEAVWQMLEAFATGNDWNAVTAHRNQDGEWISVKDKLPESNETVAVVTFNESEKEQELAHDSYDPVNKQWKGLGLILSLPIGKNYQRCQKSTKRAVNDKRHA